MRRRKQRIHWPESLDSSVSVKHLGPAVGLAVKETVTYEGKPRLRPVTIEVDGGFMRINA